MEPFVDLIRFTCPLVRSYPVEILMNFSDDLGKGLPSVGIAALMTLYGFLNRDRRVKQTGLVTLLAILIAGLLANLLKVIFQMPRPIPRGWSYGFPSGHASTAFAMAGVLGLAFPAAAPFLYLMALLAALARLYHRSHFVIDVIGGGTLGTGIGLLLAKGLLAPPTPKLGNRSTWWGWAIPTIIGAQALVFFSAYEYTLKAHRAPSTFAVGTSTTRTVIHFGTREARALLLQGWSGDESGEGRVPFVWAQGLESRLRLPSLPRADHRLRLRVQPFVAHDGPSCQVVEVALNDIPTARILVEKGWHVYETKLSKNLIRSGPNEMEFRFAYAESPAAYWPSKDERALSVAFASLEVFVDERKEAFELLELARR